MQKISYANISHAKDTTCKKYHMHKKPHAKNSTCKKNYMQQMPHAKIRHAKKKNTCKKNTRKKKTIGKIQHAKYIKCKKYHMGTTICNMYNMQKISHAKDTDGK